ncbi:MAG: MFS transporter, partial [Bdellovibrionota bacterium]
RGQWLSYYGIALSLGLLFGPALLLIGEALHLFSALNTSLWIIAASAVLMAAVCGRQNLPVLQSSGEQPKLNKYASVSAALYGFLEAGLVAVLAATVLKSFHAKVETVFITIILSAALASAGWGYLIDRWGGRKTLLALHFVLAVSLGAAALIMTFWPGERMIFISSIFFGVVAGGLYPAAFSWLAEKIHPSHLGFASGHFTRAYGFGSLLGPLCFGFAVEWYGATGLFGISAVLGAIGFGVTAVSKS